jgi:hypothetical protein
MSQTLESPRSPEASLTEFLVERARAASDTRLLIDAIGGLLVAVTFGIWQIPAWYLLSALGACFLFYGVWAVARRELDDLPAEAPRQRVIPRAIAIIGAVGGFGALAFLMLAVLAKLIGRVIS